MINYILLVIYIWVSGWVVAVYICIYILLYIHTYTLFFFNLIVKSIETFVVCAVSRINYYYYYYYYYWLKEPK